MLTPNAIPTAEAATLPLATPHPPLRRWRAGWLVALVACLLAAGLSATRLAALRRSVAVQWSDAGTLPFRPALMAGAAGGAAAVDDDRRLWLLDGNAPRPLAQLEVKPSALAIDGTTRRIYAGDALGTLTILDGATGQVLATRPMPGRITQLAALPAGGLAVCYGLSAYGPDHFITRLSDPLAGALEPGVALGFCTRQMTADAAGGLFYATMNARLGYVGPSGGLGWQRLLEQRPTALLSVPATAATGAGVLVLDRRGGLTRIAGDNAPAWTRQVSRNGLATAAADPEGQTLLAADQRGGLFLLTAGGTTLAEWPARGLPRVVDITAAGGRFVLTHSDGRQTSVPTAWGATTLPLRRLLAWSVLVLGLLGAAWSALHATQRLSAATHLTLARMRRARTAYLMLLPTFALLAVFCYWPACSALLYAFMEYSLTEPPRFIGLQNFRQMWNDPYVWVGMRNLVILVVTGIIKTLTMPLLAAELIYWLMNDRLKQWLRTSFVLPTVVPGLIGIMLWKMIYQPEAGLLNETLRALGLSQLTRPWLGDEHFAIWAIVFAGFPWISVFPFLIFLGGLINVPQDIYEAAGVDGIGVWRRFLYIDLPLIRPQIRLLLTFTFIGCIQDFTSVLVFTMGGPGNATFVPALQMFLQTAQSSNMGYASAIGVFLFALVMLATGLNFLLVKTERE